MGYSMRRVAFCCCPAAFTAASSPQRNPCATCIRDLLPAPVPVQRDHCAVADRRAAAAQAHAPGRCARCMHAAPAGCPSAPCCLGPSPPPAYPAPNLPSLSHFAEARGGLHIVEQSLWSSLPKLLRRMSSEWWLVGGTGAIWSMNAYVSNQRMHRSCHGGGARGRQRGRLVITTGSTLTLPLPMSHLQAR